MYINKAIIYGNLTRDPELKVIPSGNKVCSFSVATNRTWKDKNGARQEAADYHNVVFWGKPAETITQYMHKGSTIFVEGRLSTRSWDAPDGKKNYRTEIIGENFQFGPKLGGGGSSSATSQTEVTGGVSEEIETIEYPPDVNPEDIPF